jgi:hypothetical protein
LAGLGGRADDPFWDRHCKHEKERGSNSLTFYHLTSKTAAFSARFFYFKLYNLSMILNNAREARHLGQELANHIRSGNIHSADKALGAYLDDKNPFRLLDLIGDALSTCPTAGLFPFLDMIARGDTMGGWVVIAAALRAHSLCENKEILEKCRAFIIQAHVWYACDTFGERVPGPYLLTDFQDTVNLLSPWRDDKNPWVRRSVGVAVHFWAKRTKGAGDQLNHVRALLTFIKPMLAEKEYQAAKGVGWGLKTLGRYNPETVYEFLLQTFIVEKCQSLNVIKRKALTYLPTEMKGTLSRGQS